MGRQMGGGKSLGASNYVLYFSGAPFVSNESLRRIRDGSFRSGSLPNQGKVIAWLIDNDGNEQCNKGNDVINTFLSSFHTYTYKLTLTKNSQTNCLISFVCGKHEIVAYHTHYSL